MNKEQNDVRWKSHRMIGSFDGVDRVRRKARASPPVCRHHIAIVLPLLQTTVHLVMHLAYVVHQLHLAHALELSHFPQSPHEVIRTQFAGVKLSEKHQEGIELFFHGL